MFKALIKTRLLAFGSYMFRASKGKKKSLGMKFLIGLLAVYVIACFLFMFGAIFFQICEPFHNIKIDWFYFLLGDMMAMVLMFIGSIFMTQSQIYEAKDNDLLLSMPIPPKAILASRMVVLYIYNLIFELLVLLPLGFVYQTTVGFTLIGLLFLIVIVLILPLLILAISCIFGALLTVISSHFRNKTIVTMVLTIAFLLVYFYFYSRMNQYMQLLITNGDALAGKFRAALPLYWLGSAVPESNAVNLLLTLALCIVPFLIVYAILSFSFIRIATRKRGFAKIKYKEKSLKVNSIQNALVKRELKHFVSSPIYMINTCLGVLAVVIGIVAAIVKKDTIIQVMQEFPVYEIDIALLLGIAIAVMACTNIITAPSISLEGKNLWISRSLPVRTKDILMAKINLHLLITIPPSIVASLLTCIFFSSNIVNMILILLLPIVANTFFALLGLIINLRFPKFDWISETAAVKQSASTMITMFAGMGIVLILFLAYGLLLYKIFNLQIYIVIVTLLFSLLSYLLYRIIISKGVRIFESL